MKPVAILYLLKALTFTVLMDGKGYLETALINIHTDLILH